VFVAIAVPLVAVAAGTLLALAGGARPRVLVPVRSFALAAVLVAVIAHLLPGAIEAGGPWTLAVFAAGVAAPQLLGRLGKQHARVVTELGFVGVVLHQIGDGLVLGALSDHWDVVIAIGAHTVPLAAAVTLGIVAIRGRRAAVGRAAVLAAATIVGVVLASSGSPMIATEVSPWVNAAVAGLLVHLLSHDLPTPPRTGTEPLIEVLAIAAGVAVPLLAAHDHGGVAETLTVGLRELVCSLAIPLAIGLVAAIALEHAGARLRARLLARGSAVHGVAAAATAATCSCRVVPATRGAADHSRPAAIVAFLLAAPELGIDTLLVGGQLLGAPGTLIRLGAAVAIALLAGVVAARLAAGDHDAEHAHDHAHDHPPAPARSLLRTTDEVIIHSGPWLVLGIVASVLVGVAIPAGALAGSTALAIALAIVLAFPAYVCAAAATPLAAMLILRGLPPGAAIAGLLLGAATNRAGLALIARQYGTAAAAAATGIALVVAIATGIAIQHGLGDVVGPRAPTAFGFPDTGPLVTAALIVLAAAGLRGLWRYGLAAWLEPLHGGGEHHHHQHPEGAPCEAGCHDH
jgi:uncharacterized membrane protein YraQ (UPF0718 family)